MAKNNWKQYEEIEDEMIKILKVGASTINTIKSKLNENGYDISYGLVQRRIESLEKENTIEKIPINHQVKFYKLL